MKVPGKSDLQEYLLVDQVSSHSYQSQVSQASLFCRENYGSPAQRRVIFSLRLHLATGLGTIRLRVLVVVNIGVRL